ncbi:hypothetical protein C5167_000423 [Papaver somniferum]|uniref:Ubiquitin-like protease family profile domain-containing protein n=1 Tax=Papaver somniferum TaxID=3469 RepID=A0A4Y7KSK9_PAPSO|nr:hypothetical protein C5167_000423 [Papaver somniferum]
MGKKKNKEMIIILDVESETSDCSEEVPKTITRPTSLGLVEKFDKSPSGPPLRINCTIPQRKQSKMRRGKIYSSISTLSKPSKKIMDKKVPIRKQDQNSKNFPRREPSKRIINSKIPVRKENQLDTNKFHSYFEWILRMFFRAGILYGAPFRQKERTLSHIWIAFGFPCTGKRCPRKGCWPGLRADIFFQKNMFLFPLSHWSLLILCHFGESLESTTTKPCMLLLDSLEIADPRRFEPDIRKFILDIYKVEGKPDHKKTIGKIPLLVPKVPQQKNKDDCGFFVLYFMEMFMRCAPDNFSIDKGYPYFMDENWFSAESVQTFCEKVTFFCR